MPIVLGGGHETAYGHFLGYAALRKQVGVINLDAHLDVRPVIDSRGHSGTPFRQMIEHAEFPLPGSHYVCLGAQPSAVCRDHLRYVKEKGGVVRWHHEVAVWTRTYLHSETQRLGEAGCLVYVSLDADVVHQAEVPGVSAPNAQGVSGTLLLDCARLAGQSPHVASFDLVEINPRLDRDGQSSRWAALVIWNFLMGLTERCQRTSS